MHILINLLWDFFSFLGKEYSANDDVFVDNPDMLDGKDVNFLVKINNARSLHARFTVSGLKI